jgi:hypothetical protein
MSVNYRLDVQHEFNFVPGTDKPVGYLAKATLFGKSLPADIKVTAPLVPATSTTLPGPGPVTAVGVIQNLSWDGGDDSAFNFSFYFSQANATLIRSLQQQLVETNAITQLDWWVAAFDAETKQWYEACYPKGNTMSGLVMGAESVTVASEPTTFGPVSVYQVSLTLLPAAGEPMVLNVAAGTGKATVLPWGLPIGTGAAE